MSGAEGSKNRAPLPHTLCHLITRAHLIIKGECITSSPFYR